MLRRRVERDGACVEGMRLDVGAGVAEMAITSMDGGHGIVRVAHAMLSSPEEGAHLKAHCAHWLKALHED